MNKRDNNPTNMNLEFMLTNCQIIQFTWDTLNESAAKLVLGSVLVDLLGPRREAQART